MKSPTATAAPPGLTAAAIVPLDDLRRRRVMKLATPLACRKVEDAAGRCLALSLELALQARDRLDLELQLVRWHVDGDPEYIEHWAVQVAPDEVLDPTHVQVDGRAAVRARLSAYPSHFTRPRSYPASLLLPAYEAVRAAGGDRLPTGFLAGCALRILAHDLRQARRARAPALAMRALGEAWRFAGVFSLKCVGRWLDSRAQVLGQRLQDQADVASRSSGLADRGTADQARGVVKVAATVTAAMIAASAGPQPAPVEARPLQPGRPALSQRT